MLRRHNERERADAARGWIKNRSDVHEIDETWWLREYEVEGRNRRRLAQFNVRTRLFKFTVPMEHQPAAPVADGTLGTFHHPV